MAKAVSVKVRRTADDVELDMPYRSFNFIRDDIDDMTHQKKFELIGELDEAGNLVEGNPNLLPHDKQAVQNAAAVDNGAETKRKPGRPAAVKLQETQA